MSRYFYFAVIFVLAVTMFATTTQAQAPPSADTYVSSSTPKTNYGFSPILVVQPGTTTFIQFNLAALPTGASVNKATLRLYLDGVITGGSFDVFPVNGAWSESTLTYNTPPPSLGASATGNKPIAITTATFSKFLLIDITSLVQGWVSGTTANNGVALVLTTTNGIFSFDAKESLLTGNGPELEIVLNGPAGPQGIQGMQGPAGSTGSQGPQGSPGAPGSTGPAGPQGAQGPIGAVGPQGSQGLQGVSGPTGPQGPQGIPGINNRGSWNSSNTYNPADAVYDAGSYWIATAQNTNSAPSPVNTNWQLLAAGINNRGPWVSTNNYNVNDAVSDGGSFWLALAANNNSEPAIGNTQWQQLAAQGAAGSAGPAGPGGTPGGQGPQGPQGGQGPQGPQGFQGPQGPPGPILPDLAYTDVANTFTTGQTVNGSLTAMGFNIGSNPFAFGSYANQNAFLGFAGNTTTTATANTASGWQALLANTSGVSNAAFGAGALQQNTSGFANTASGAWALLSNTTGFDNTASGENVMFQNTTGNSNTASGVSALYANTSGYANTASGTYAVGSNTIGNNNTGLGEFALYWNTTGSLNTALGNNAGPDQNSPNLTNATAIGALAQVSQSNALVLGSIAGVNNATASANVGIGTTTPQYTLDVHGTGNFTGLVNFAPGQTFPGAVGPQGPQGPQGPAGATGATGLAGPQGPIGSAGAIGATGATGPQGPIGLTGATGPQGPPGTGVAGAAGLSIVPFSATPTFDASHGNTMKLTLTGDVTSSTLTNALAGETLNIVICQDTIGGHAFAPPSNVQWSTVPTTTANYCSAQSFAFDGTTAFSLQPIGYTVSVSVGPLYFYPAGDLMLVLNGGLGYGSQMVFNGPGEFRFLTQLYPGQPYQVSILSWPNPPWSCSLPSNATGAMTAANVLIGVQCVLT